ncbi:hypothetical protein P8605_35340, partial [Streptomyces sp. T-3]|nr:hypothetical protein [Streptomyces sp. T-3]
MSQGQINKLFQLMAGGEAVEFTSKSAMVKKLARLSFIAEEFGYQYADTVSMGQDGTRLLLLPDPSPQAQQRAARSWAQYPQAGSGGPLPPYRQDALDLLKARIMFDMTRKGGFEKRMAWGAGGLTVGCAVSIGSGENPAVWGSVWAGTMVLLGAGFLWTRQRNAKYDAVLRSAGFSPVTDGTG